MYTLNCANKPFISLPTLGMMLSWLNDRAARNHVDENGNPLMATEMQISQPNGERLNVIVNAYGSAGAEFTGNPSTWLSMMMAEGLEQIEGKGRRPYQMLHLEWAGLNAIGKLAYGVYPGLAKGEDNEGFMHKLFMEQLGYGHNGPKYGNGHDTNCRHDVHVAYALANNDEIPQEVLDEYVELDKHRLVWKYDCKWASELLQKPWLRGEFTAGQLRLVLNHLRNKDCSINTITPENLVSIKQVVSSLPVDFGPDEINAAFREKGWFLCQ